MLGIPFMRGIYTYIPETNHVPREHGVAAILVLLFIVLISLVPALTPLYLYGCVHTNRVESSPIQSSQTHEDAAETLWITYNGRRDSAYTPAESS